MSVEQGNHVSRDSIRRFSTILLFALGFAALALAIDLAGFSTSAVAFIAAISLVTFVSVSALGFLNLKVYLLARRLFG